MLIKNSPNDQPFLDADMTRGVLTTCSVFFEVLYVNQDIDIEDKHDFGFEVRFFLYKKSTLISE